MVRTCGWRSARADGPERRRRRRGRGRARRGRRRRPPSARRARAAAAAHFARGVVARSPKTSSGPSRRSSVEALGRRAQLARRAARSSRRRGGGDGERGARVRSVADAAAGRAASRRRAGRSRPRCTPRRRPSPATGDAAAAGLDAPRPARCSTTSIGRPCGKSVSARRPATDVKAAHGVAQRVLAHVQRGHVRAAAARARRAPAAPSLEDTPVTVTSRRRATSDESRSHSQPPSRPSREEHGGEHAAGRPAHARRHCERAGVDGPCGRRAAVRPLPGRHRRLPRSRRRPARRPERVDVAGARA